MINQIQRDAIRKYFYGTKGPAVLATLGTVCAFFIGVLLHRNKLFITLPALCLLVAAIWKLKERFAPDVEGEKQYENQLEQDMTDFAVRALEKLGLVSEQVSMIEPIKVRGPYYDYTEYDVDKHKSSTIQKLLSSIKILCCFIYLPYIGIKMLMNKSYYTPQLIFRYGTDEQVRYSMVQINIFIFSENQIYVYTGSYDICSGEIYEENTAEYFYQDVDCVITGSKVEKVVSNKKVENKYFEYFKLIVTSGTSTSAIADGQVSILNTQIRGMRELIRSKKMEITL